MKRQTIPSQFPAESTDELVYLVGRDSLTICGVVSLSGYLDYDRLARAVRLSCDAQPILGCRFVERAWRSYWQRRSDLDDQPLCAQTPVTSDEAMDQAITDFVVQKLCPAKDPLISARVLRGATTDTLCIKMAHVVGDGAAFRQYLELLADLYNKLEADPTHAPAPDMGSRSYRQLVADMSLGQQLRLVRDVWKDRKPSRNTGAWQFVDSASLESGTGFVRCQANAEDLAGADAWRRKHGLSWNQLVLSAYFRALTRHVPHQEGTDLGLVMTAELRRRNNGSTVFPIANLSSANFLQARSDSGRSFQETASMMRQLALAKEEATQGFKAHPTVAAEVFPIRQLKRMIPFAVLRALVKRALPRARVKAKQKAAVLTNVGPIDPDSVRFGELQPRDAYMTAGAINAFATMVSSFRGNWCISTIFNKQVFSRGLVESVLQETLAVLSDLSSESGQVQGDRSADPGPPATQTP